MITLATDTGSILTTLGDFAPSISLLLPKKTADAHQYYAHVIRESGKIVAIAKTQIENNESMICIPISDKEANDFVTNVKRLSTCQAVPDGASYRIIEKTLLSKVKFARLDQLKLRKLEHSDCEGADLFVEFDSDSDDILVHFNGESIYEWGETAKLYFVDADNPSILKCILSLDINTLSRICLDNDLREWPNPIRVNIKDSEDIAVYTTKMNIKVGIKNV